MRAFTSNGRRAAPCCDTRPASGCQGFFLSQSSVNIHVNKQKGIYPETSRLLLFLNSIHNRTLSITFTLLCTIQTKERLQLRCAHSLQPHGLGPSQFLSPWDFPGKNTGVGNHFFLQGILPAQASIPHLFGLASPA